MKQQSGMAMVALASLGAVLILVFGYMFGVSAQLSAAGIANDEHALAVKDNKAIERQIDDLKTLELEVPGWQADSEAVAAQIPSLPDTEHLHRMLITAATDAGIPWVEFKVEGITVIDAAANAAQAPAAPAKGDTTTEDAGSADEGSGDPTPAPTESATPDIPAGPVNAASVEGLVAVQFTATSEGHPESLLRFLTNMYEQTKRFVTFSRILIEGSDGADAAPGRPGLVRGDGSITVSGVAFVLIDPANPLEIDESGGETLPPSLVPSPSASPSPSPSASS